MKYKCINNKFHDHRITKNESDYSSQFTIGKLYDISNTDNPYSFLITESDSMEDLIIPHRMLKSMFISVVDLRNEKIESIING